MQRGTRHVGVSTSIRVSASLIILVESLVAAERSDSLPLAEVEKIVGRLQLLAAPSRILAERRQYEIPLGELSGIQTGSPLAAIATALEAESASIAAALEQLADRVATPLLLPHTNWVIPSNFDNYVKTTDRSETVYIRQGFLVSAQTELVLGPRPYILETYTTPVADAAHLCDNDQIFLNDPTGLSTQLSNSEILSPISLSPSALSRIADTTWQVAADSGRIASRVVHIRAGNGPSEPANAVTNLWIQLDRETELPIVAITAAHGVTAEIGWYQYNKETGDLSVRISARIDQRRRMLVVEQVRLLAQDRVPNGIEPGFFVSLKTVLLDSRNGRSRTYARGARESWPGDFARYVVVGEDDSDLRKQWEKLVGATKLAKSDWSNSSNHGTVRPWIQNQRLQLCAVALFVVCIAFLACSRRFPALRQQSGFATTSSLLALFGLACVYIANRSDKRNSKATHESALAKATPAKESNPHYYEDVGELASDVVIERSIRVPRVGTLDVASVLVGCSCLKHSVTTSEADYWRLEFSIDPRSKQIGPFTEDVLLILSSGESLVVRIRGDVQPGFGCEPNYVLIPGEAKGQRLGITFVEVPFSYVLSEQSDKFNVWIESFDPTLSTVIHPALQAPYGNKESFLLPLVVHSSLRTATNGARRSVVYLHGTSPQVSMRRAIYVTAGANSAPGDGRVDTSSTKQVNSW